MQDPRGFSTLKPKKVKKAVTPTAVNPKLQSPIMHPRGVDRETVGGPKQKATPTKRGFKNVGSSNLPNPDSLLTGPGSAEDYRVLRRKYLMLEEESFSLDKDLAEADAEARALEEEKSALLDQLVVLEGLVGPSEVGSRRGRM
ncbi:hypothetical protein LUZ61_011584 [Rhynchospora tenuis]|uniref:Uncharacterized protein n=1 Tax=Rhynchospora tenuis TaxID=198213 RepID=A0AAD6A1J6_9POAL|nr:hypothetical protein LUZ61_011584 [Rhynchospora tenuis]